MSLPTGTLVGRPRPALPGPSEAQPMTVEGLPATAQEPAARPSGTPKIELRQIQKQFVVRKQIVEAVQKTTIAIPDGQFVCLLGPSGCGKTTLLRIVAGLETPTAGSVHVERTGGN